MYFFSFFENKRTRLCIIPANEKIMSITESIEQNKSKKRCVLSKKF